MTSTLHITSGDGAGELLIQANIPGEVFVWHDILYDGPRNPGWPDDATLQARADFLDRVTAGGMGRQVILQTLRHQYLKLESIACYDRVVLWFDACLFDQSMLCHLLTCLQTKEVKQLELICVDAFSGIDPYHGLGQLTVEQLAACYDRHRPVTVEMFSFATAVDGAFARRDKALFSELARIADAPMPWIPAAASRWLKEFPDAETELGLLEQLAFEAISEGGDTPGKIFTTVAAKDSPPQYWGDITLWAKINALADRVPPRVRIEGPEHRLPQWGGPEALQGFRITPLPSKPATDH